MTKTELVAAISVKAGISKADAEKALNALQETIIEAVSRGEKVSLVGFGNFNQIKRSARKGRNPQTGEEINIPASKAPKFSPGKAFKEAVN